ncbi:MAG: hypothetical protein Q9162_006310, partial [Coniocarpon cinnabarinum]
MGQKDVQLNPDHYEWLLDNSEPAEPFRYVATTLLPRYELREDKDDKSIISVDDLFNLLHYYWVLSPRYYRTERDRIQHALVILLMVYNDLRLYVVRDPSRNGSNALLMTIKLRLYKGRRNAGTAPVFVFYKRDDNLSFCPILYVLALAFADKAFCSEWLQSPDNVSKIEMPSCLESVPLEWKPEVATKPIVRAAVRGEYGWSTSDTAALGASNLLEWTRNLSKDAGFEQRITLYAFRRGAGNAVN